MEIVFDIKDHKTIIILLKVGKAIIGQESLTVSQEFDSMLIKALDKLVSGNKIDRLSLKTVEIAGKLETAATSAMILSAVKDALSS